MAISPEKKIQPIRSGLSSQMMRPVSVTPLIMSSSWLKRKMKGRMAVRKS
jgi:hypothetical protein